MNNTSKSPKMYILLAVGTVFILAAACGEPMPIITSTPTPLPPTVNGSYFHFAPSEESPFRLEFDYPMPWIFREDADIPGIVLQDPRSRDVPTPLPDVPDGWTLTDFGSIFIWVQPVTPSQTLVSRVEDYKQGHDGVHWITALGEYTTEIDGYAATVLEYQIDNPELYTSVMFERSVFFTANNQIYLIIFTVAVKDRGGDFEEGYNYFIDSLKILR